MDLSPQQEDAERRVLSWLNAHRIAQGSQSRATVPQTFRLFGYAGTGKSTLLKRLLQDVTWGPVLAATFTGKAASVVTRKGVECSTIHQLIYKPAGEKGSMLKELQAEERKLLTAIEKAEGPDAGIRAELRTVRDKLRVEREDAGRPFFQRNPDSLLRGAAVLALDEVSMVDQPMGEDLLSFDAPILALGDPAQLPPVKGSGYFTQGRPDVLLTEVHRQAEGSPILMLATAARMGHALPQGLQSTDQGRAEVMRGRPHPDHVLAADQVLCGRNATRIALNRRIRDLKGLDPNRPEPGDKLVCLRNNRDMGLLNGTLWTVDAVRAAGERGKLLLSLTSDEGVPLDQVITAHEAPFLGQDVPHYELRDAEHFDYGYALTVHKSQGSQWGSVVLFDDWTGSSRREWLYTGVTRAADSLLVVQ